MKHLMPLLIFTIFCLVSCAHKKHHFNQVQDNDLTIQAMRLETDEQFVSYDVRIIPAKALLKNITGILKERMIYKMDSSFYLNTPRGENRAVMVQPVANGISGTYEYLLEFEKSGSVTDSMALIFKDHVLNDKTYSIAFK